MSLRDREWLGTDGLGGFASGAVSGMRARRYHGLLVLQLRPAPLHHRDGAGTSL